MGEIIKRVPSIHITVDQLEYIFDELQRRGLIDITYPYKIKKAEIFQEIARIAALKPLNMRSLNIHNKKDETKAVKAVITVKGDALTFSRLLVMIRKSLKHRGISLINQSSKDWKTIQMITASATQFCNDFGLSIQDGYKKYIEMGISKMDGTYSLYKFPRLHESICRVYESQVELENSPMSSLATEMFEYYKSVMYKRTQIEPTYLDSPDKKLAFKKAADIATEMGISGRDYIEAQFDALSFANGVPTPDQLYGEKAKERLIKYLYENNKQANKHNSTPAVDLKKLKSLK